MNIGQLKMANNQIIIMTEKEEFFKSYGKTIAIKRKDGQVYLSLLWYYNKTTLKYLKLFLGINFTTKQIKEKIYTQEYLPLWDYPQIKK